MVQVHTGRAAPGTSIVRDNMHRDRKRVFVDMRKWDDIIRSLPPLLLDFASAASGRPSID
jgi:hypothetical protein